VESKWTPETLIAFEQAVAQRFNAGLLPYPIHLSGGNERELIEIFAGVESRDWVFSTHRSHYHYLLKGGDPDNLAAMINAGKSMHIYDRGINFFTSSIVAGCPTIAVGVAAAITEGRVWCFVGDGAEAEGAFYEAVRFADTESLPITFIVEDNGLAVDTPTYTARIGWPPCVTRYKYTRTRPHVNTGKIVGAYL